MEKRFQHNSELSEHFFPSERQERISPTSVTLLNKRFTVKVKSSVKQAEAEPVRSYPLYSEIKFAPKTANGPPDRKTIEKRKFGSTFIYSRDRGQPGKPNPKTGLNK